MSAPSPIRGCAMHLSVDKDGKLMAYASGKTAVVRPVSADAAAPSQGFVFRHTATVTLAKLSPRGTFCLSGDENGNVVIWAVLADTPVKYRMDGMLGGPIRDAAWSDDQERVVVCGDARGESAKAFAVNGGNTIGEIKGHQKPIASIDFRPTRPFRVVSGGQDSQINLHEGPPFKFAKGVSAGFQNVVTCVKFSPGGDLCAATSSAPAVQLVQGQTGDAAGEIKTDHKGTVMSVDWAADGSAVVTASADKSVHAYAKGADGGAWAKVWATELGKDVGAMQYGACYVEGGAKVLACGLDGTLSYLAAATGAVVAQARGHARPVILVAEGSADGAAMLTAGSDGRVLAWAVDPATGAIRSSGALPEHKVETVNCVAATAGGAALLAFGGGKTFVAPGVAGPLTARGLEHAAIACARLGADHVVTVTRGALTVLSAAGEKKAEQELKSLGFGDITTVAASAAGNAIAVAGGTSIAVFAFDGAAFVKKAEYKGAASPHRAAVTRLAFSPSGALLASGDTSRTVAVWDIAQGVSLYDDLCFHNGAINALAFFDDGTLASGAVDGNVIIWNLADKTRKVATDVHPGGVTALAKVGAFVVSAGFSGNVLVWKPYK